ncbi:MAG: MFS transporter [Salinirussus sp.]
MARFDSLALLRNREFAALAGSAFARSQAYSTILIALALYADLFGTTGFVEGLFGTTFALVQLVVVVPLGRRIDAGNAKRWLLYGFLLNVAVFIGFILVSNAVHVILVRMLQGLGASTLWITGATVVGQISPDADQGRWLGAYNQVGALSSMAGDLVGGYLLFAYGFVIPYLVLTAITLGAFVLVWVALRDDPGGRPDPDSESGIAALRSLLALPMLRALIGFRFAFSFGKMAVIIFLPIYARTSFGLSAFVIGWILAGGKLTKALAQGYVGGLTDRWGHRRHFVAAGAGLYGVGTAMIPLAGVLEGAIPAIHLSVLGGTQTLGGAFLALFVAYALLGIADSLRLPASMSLFVDEGEREDSVASAMSLRSLSWKGGQVAGPVAVGVVMDAFGVTSGFILAAGFVGVATAGFVIAARRAHAARSGMTGAARAD